MQKNHVFLLLLFVVFYFIQLNTANNNMSEEYFLYFAYGSNLLEDRIRINNPSAIKYKAGVLKNYRLDFYRYSNTWNGSAATIVEDNDEEVWGQIWKIDISNLEDLDRQEGVDINWYKILHKDIKTIDGDIVSCKTYQQVDQPTNKLNSFDNIPYERQPSKTYLDVIIKGAIECKLPEIYINFLKQYPHNGQLAAFELREKLKLN